MEVAVLQLLGLAQRLLGVADDLGGLGVLVDKAGNNLPTLVGTCRKEHQTVSLLALSSSRRPSSNYLILCEPKWLSHKS